MRKKRYKISARAKRAARAKQGTPFRGKIYRISYRNSANDSWHLAGYSPSLEDAKRWAKRETSELGAFEAKVDEEV